MLQYHVAERSDVILDKHCTRRGFTAHLVTYSLGAAAIGELPAEPVAPSAVDSDTTAGATCTETGAVSAGNAELSVANDACGGQKEGATAASSSIVPSRIQTSQCQQAVQLYPIVNQPQQMAITGTTDATIVTTILDRVYTKSYGWDDIVRFTIPPYPPWEPPRQTPSIVTPSPGLVLPHQSEICPRSQPTHMMMISLRRSCTTSPGTSRASRSRPDTFFMRACPPRFTVNVSNEKLHRSVMYTCDPFSNMAVCAVDRNTTTASSSMYNY